MNCLKNFLLIVIILISGCKKDVTPNPPPVTTPRSVLRLSSFSAKAFSGADMYYSFSYKDSLLTKVVEHNISSGDSITFLFNYNGAQLSSVGFYYNEPAGSKAPYTQISAWYANNKIDKVEWFYNLNDSLIPSAYFKYTYNSGGKLIGKKSYNVFEGKSKLISTHTYVYDSSDNIIKVASTYTYNGATTEFDNSFAASENKFFINNPALYVFYWYLFNLNNLVEGFPEAQIYSHNNLIATNRIGNYSAKEILFDFIFTKEGLWQSIFILPDVYSDAYVLFYDMNFSYVLQTE
jgi:hypothetical protein